MAGTCRSCSRSSQALQCTPMWMHANAGCREGRPRPRPATRCWHEMALMVTESCRHTNQLGTSKKTKTYIITSKNKNLHYAAPECVTTQPDVDSIALRVLLEKMLYLIAPLDTNLLPLQAHGTTQTAGMWPRSPPTTTTTTTTQHSPKRSNICPT